MADIDLLSPDEQNILLWLGEAEISVAEPLTTSIASFSSEQLNVAVDRLIRCGFLSQELPWPDGHRAGDHTTTAGLCVSLTGRGARLVVELWLRRFREQPRPRKTA